MTAWQWVHVYCRVHIYYLSPWKPNLMQSLTFTTRAGELVWISSNNYNALKPRLQCHLNFSRVVVLSSIISQLYYSQKTVISLTFFHYLFQSVISFNMREFWKIVGMIARRSIHIFIHWWTTTYLPFLTCICFLCWKIKIAVILFCIQLNLFISNHFVAGNML